MRESLEEQQKNLADSMESSAQDQQSAVEESLREQAKMFEEQREAIEEAQRATENALEEAAEKHRETVSEAWKLQAESKASRAYDLYKAGMYDESLRLCLEVISQDPGNMRGYRLAAWLLEKTGQGARAREMLEKQIKLLKTNEFRGTPKTVLKVLIDILDAADNQDLMKKFLEVSQTFEFFPAVLLDELLNRSQYDVARNLHSAHDKNYTLEILAYDIEILGKSGNSINSQKLERHLKQLPHTERENVFGEYIRLKGDGALSETTLEIVRKKIQDRYREWGRDIENEFSESATTQTLSKIKKESGGWVVGLILFFVIQSFAGALIALVISIPLALVLNHSIKSFVRNRNKNKIIASMREVEKDKIDRIGFMGR